MSKADKAKLRALKAYPIKIAERDGYDENLRERKGFVKGYHQAEKDLELTWEDIKQICDISFEEACRLQRNMKGSLIYKKQHYQKVLKRFKNLKK